MLVPSILQKISLKNKSLSDIFFDVYLLASRKRLQGGAETTDIENIKQDTVEANTTRNLSTYNLNGMKVYNTKPGHIYIRGGKKFVAK